jgi:hypothetical protein
MSKHVTISPEEAADRLAVRELIEAYAHWADRRAAKGQMALFTADTHFVLYMDAKNPNPSGAAFTRGARSGLRRANQVRCHHTFRRSERHLHSDGPQGHERSLLPSVPRYGRRRKAALDGRLAPLRRHVREDGGAWLFAERKLYVNWLDERALS